MVKREILSPADVWVPQKAGFSHPQPFSQGMKVTGGSTFIFVAGQVALDKDGRVIGEGDALEQTRAALRNMEAVLREGGATLKDVVRLTVYVTDMAHFPQVQQARAEFFPENPPPSTSLQVSRLVRDELLVEIDAIAVI